MPCRNPLDHAPHDYLADSDAITLSPCPGKETAMAWEMPEADTMDETLAMMHETYEGMQRVGFTRHEALHILTGTCCKGLDDE